MRLRTRRSKHAEPTSRRRPVVIAAATSALVIVAMTGGSLAAVAHDNANNRGSSSSSASTSTKTSETRSAQSAKKSNHKSKKHHWNNGKPGYKPGSGKPSRPQPTTPPTPPVTVPPVVTPPTTPPVVTPPVVTPPVVTPPVVTPPVTVPPVTTPPGSWPTAETTGYPAGTALKPMGGLTITTPGAVYDGIDFNGTITVKADNVTIRNSKVTGRIDIRAPYKGLMVQRVEIIGPGDGYTTKYPGIGYDNFTCDGCNIHGWGDGAMFDSNATIINSWIHDISVSGDSHNQAILSLGGPNVTIVNNRLDAGKSGHFTAALSLLNQWNSFSNALVKDNLFNGGGYCVYAGGEAKGNSKYPSSNVKFINNTFGTDLNAKCGYYGPATAFDARGAGNEWSGNVMSNGKVVTAPPAN